MSGVGTLDEFLASFATEPGYLNWAGFGPLSPTVRDEVAADLELLASGRRSGLDLVESRPGEARALIAELVGGRAADATLQPSATHGLMQAIYGVSGGVVASAAEFPSIPVAIARAAELGRVTPQWIGPEHRFVTPEAIASVLDESSSAVVVSLVDFRTGYRADLAGIREVIGDDRLLVVDATQAFGVVDEDYTIADVVAGHGYKWLRAGRGTGFAWFGPRARVALEPVLSGASGTTADEIPYDLTLGTIPGPAPDGRAFTVARPDPLAAAGLAVALGEVASTGVALIEAEISQRTGRIIDIAEAHGIEVVTPRDPARRAGIVALAPPAREVGMLGAALSNGGITAITRSGLVRVSAHAGTDDCTLRMFDDACAAFTQMRPR
jgi:selenocysteine lyase/cysteine desulfurase